MKISKEHPSISLIDFKCYVPNIEHNSGFALIDVISIPQSLTCLGSVARNLLNCLELIDQFDQFDEIDTFPTTQLISAAEKILSINPQQQLKIPAFSGSVTDQPGPLHGEIGHFPLYAMLARKIKSNDNELLYFTAILSIMLCVHELKMRSQTKQIEFARYKSRIDSACRDLRQISPNNFNLLPHPQPLDNYLAALSSFISPNDPLYGLKLLIRAAEEGDVPGLRRVRNRNLSKLHQVRVKRLDWDNDDIDLPALNIIEIAGLSYADERSSIEEGCAPMEVLQPIQYIETEREIAEQIPELAQADPPISALYVRAKRQRDYLIRSAQHLPKRWERLQPVDCWQYILSLVKLASTGQKSGPSTISDPELALFLAVTFWLSAPAERVCALKYVTDVDDFPRCCPDDKIYYARQQQTWCIPVLKSKVINAKSHQQTGQARLLAARLCLPDFGDLGWFFDQAHIIPNPNTPVFLHPLSQYHAAVQFWLNTPQVNPGKRITLNRIQHTIFWCLAETSSDIAHAALTLCHPHTDADTYLHYYTPSEESIRLIYTKTCKHFSRLLTKDNIKSPQPPLAQNYIGSPICPTDQAVRHLVSALKSSVALKQHALSSHHIADLHNALVMYVATMLGAATGYRSVRDPLNDRRHYDVISRRAIIADKTDDAHHGTRIAILPEILCQQLLRYEVHLRAMLPALALLNPMTHQQLKRLLMSTSGNDDMPFLFLLDETLKVKRMQPASVKPYLQLAGWSLPTNSNRHYLRTKLREAGATGEEVAIILGHWQYGQEPYSLFSTTGLDSIEARVEPMLTNLMAESGWEVMGGLE